jgi:formylmethanofuran dehydrogenase subunit C
MANIITAGNSTNGGTAISTDTSGTLNIVTGSGSGSTAVTVDGSGNMVVTGSITGGSISVANSLRAWVNFNGTGTPAIRASGNVSSITDNGLGDYTVNFTTAMVDANYSVISSSEGGGSVGNPPYQRGNYPITSTTNIRLTFFNQSASVFVDPTYCCAAIFR